MADAAVVVGGAGWNSRESHLACSPARYVRRGGVQGDLNRPDDDGLDAGGAANCRIRLDLWVVGRALG